MKSAKEEASKAKKIVTTVLLVILIPTVLTALGGSIYLFVLFQSLPEIGDLEKSIAESTVLLDRNGNEIYKLYNEENRQYIALSEVGDNFKHAILSIEDKNFYEHPGVDLFGIARAALSNLQGKQMQGASTITQQVVKNLVLKSNAQTPERKIKEAILAYQVERKYSKDKILELYVNQISFGGTAHGIQLAAQSYFSKNAKDLTIAEAATLASIPNGPTYFSPFGAGKPRLLGSCTLGKPDGKNVGEGVATAPTEGVTQDTFAISILARDRVWVKIVADGTGAPVFEGILEKGKQAEATAKESFQISTGNKSFDLFVGEEALKLPKEQTFTINKKDYAKNIATTENIQSNNEDTYTGIDGCTSIDDQNYIKGRKDLVLIRMMEDGYITKDQVDQAWKESHKLVFERKKDSISYPHFVMYVRQYLEEKYGEDVSTKGYIVKTTIDPEMQVAGEEILKKKGDENAKSLKVGNSSLVAVEPGTGQVLAMVGSRDYWDEANDGNVNVAVSLRQPGSSFKPFIYAALFEGKWGAGSVLWDVQTKFGGSTPQNYEGGFKGPMTVRMALAASRNIPAIKAFFLADGEEKVLDFVGKLGFGYLRTTRDERNVGKADEDKWYYGWPIALGAGEVRGIDMAAGYAAFANEGKYIPPITILEITTRSGEIIERWDEKDNSQQAMDPQVAYQIANILADPNARPAGTWRSVLTVPGQIAAAKTGTSNKVYKVGNTSIKYPSDLWTVGFSKYVSVAVWSGNNDGSALKPVGGRTPDGLTVSAPIWKEFMTRVHANKEKKEFTKPDGIVSVSVSTLSGLRASKSTPKDYITTDIFSSWAAPKDFDKSSAVKVDSRNGLLADDDCAEAVVVERVSYNVHSERPDWPAWENPVRAWAASKGFGGGNAKPTNTNGSDKSPLCQKTPDDKKLTLSIIAPNSNGMVAAGKVNVQISLNAPLGASKVEYYMDGALQMTRTSEPFTTGFVTLPSDTGSHSIKVVAYDINMYSASSEIAVKVGVDSAGPQIGFTNPGGDSYDLGSSVAVTINAYDEESSIQSVNLSLNGELIKVFKAPPFSHSLFLNKSFYKAGTYVLRAVATDQTGNTSSTETTFVIKGAVAEPEPQPATTNENAAVEEEKPSNVNAA